MGTVCPGTQNLPHPPPSFSHQVHLFFIFAGKTITEGQRLGFIFPICLLIHVVRAFGNNIPITRGTEAIVEAKASARDRWQHVTGDTDALIDHAFCGCEQFVKFVPRKGHSYNLVSCFVAAGGKLSPNNPQGPDVHRGHATPAQRLTHRGVVSAHPLKHNTYSPAARKVIDPRNPEHSSRTLPNQAPPPPPYHRAVHAPSAKTVTIHSPTSSHHNTNSGYGGYQDRPHSPNYKLQGSHRLHSATEGGYNVQSRTYFDPRNDRGVAPTTTVTLSESDHEGPFISKDVMV